MQQLRQQERNETDLQSIFKRLVRKKLLHNILCAPLSPRFAQTFLKKKVAERGEGERVILK